MSISTFAPKFHTKSWNFAYCTGNINTKILGKSHCYYAGPKPMERRMWGGGEVYD